MSAYFRWVVAAAGLVVLAWLLAGAQTPWSRPALTSTAAATTVPPTTGDACPADAPPAPLHFTLKNVDDQPVTLSDFKGKVLLLDFWATWCGPCKIEIPGFIDLQERYGKDGFQVVGVSVDDTPDKLRPYVADMKMNYPVLQGLGRDDVLDAFGPMFGIPLSVMISRDGRMCGRHIGYTVKDRFEAEIKSLL